MISKEYNSVGFNVNISVPETVAEYDTLAKKTGACLDSAIANVVYRGVLATFRDDLATVVENNTGISRKTSPVLDKTGNPKVEKETVTNADGTQTTTETPITKFDETEKVYLDRVWAILSVASAGGTPAKFASPEAAAASFTAIAQSTMDKIVFNPAETERTPSGPKKIAKAYTAIAEKALAAGKLDTLAANLATKLGDWKVDATVDSVARAISEDQRRQNAAKNLGGEYGVS